MRILILLFLLGITARGDILRYDSGLIRSLSNENGTEYSGEKEKVIAEFIEKNAPPEVSWVRTHQMSDGTHSHFLYVPYYRGIRVSDQYLKLSFSHKGWLEYASNTLEAPISVATAPVTKDSKAQVEAAVRLRIEGSGVKFNGIIDTEPTIWIDPKTKVSASVFDVKAYNPSRERMWWFIVSDGGRILAEKTTVIYVSNKVYKVHPARTPLEAVSISGLLSESKLRSSDFYVKREEIGGTTVEVDPRVNFSAASSFSTDPEDYDTACTGTSAQCPNQGFDAVNVYYHLSTFRSALDSRLQALGATVNFVLDPLPVYVNACPEGMSSCANNAFFSYSVNSSGVMTDGFIMFLRPATQTNKYYDVAREGSIVVHEFQHYLNILIANLDYTESDDPSVGSMLHEGYADYVGLSHVSSSGGQTVSVIMEYMGLEDASITRNLAVLSPFGGSGFDYEAHAAGKTWGSGLWRLREQLGAEVADLLVLKSLFFLSPKPSLAEAVDSLIRADTHLNAGVNGYVIRSTFFDELKFYGGDRIVYLNLPTAVLDFGFSSCVSVPSGQSPLSLLVALIWLVTTLAIGRRKCG